MAVKMSVTRPYQHAPEKYTVIGKDLEAFLIIPESGKKLKPCAVFHAGMILNVKGWQKDAAGRQWFKVDYATPKGEPTSAWFMKE